MKKKRLLVWALLVVVLISEGCATVRGIGKDIQSLGRALKSPVSGGYANASVVTYPAPLGGIPLSSDFSVTADGRQVDVYQVKVPPQWIGYTPCPLSYEIASMAYFDFSGTVKVQITSTRPVSSAVVRPLRHGIEPSVNGNTISFTLSRPLNLSVEINGDDRHNLHLFANPMETNAPSPSDPNVIYYGPGVYGDGSEIVVQNGNVYIAGGAVIYGGFALKGSGSIRGRGIISGGRNSKCYGGGTTTYGGYVNLEGGVTNLEGFIILDNTAWMITVIDSESFTMNNVKAIAMLGNGDGLDLTSVSRASVKNSFIRATDDTFAIKSDPPFMRQTNRPTENVVIEDSVGWADGAGHAIAFMEQTTPYVRNIVFRNIDILHSYVDAVWFQTGVNVYDVTLDDVRVEDMRGGYIFNIEGVINNLNVNNFSLLQLHPPRNRRHQ
jgi:predicted small secreted protein